MANNQQLLLGEGAGSAPAVYIEDVFSTYLYTGNGSTQTITNGIDLSTKGGLVWLKSRSGADSHELTNTVQGTSNSLRSNTTNGASSTDLTGFTSSGFTLGYVTGNTNASGATEVSWTFRKQPKFFDVVTWTGNSTAGRQISHNLGSTPGCIIIKSTSDGSAGYPWVVWHRTFGSDEYMTLNSTDAKSTGYPYYVVSANSTTFTINQGAAVNGNASTFVAYLFAHDAGGFGLTGTDNVISCGSVTTTSGISTVNLGYEPQYLLMKQSNGADSWWIVDNMRGWSQTGYQRLLAESSGAESTVGSNSINLTSTGFTVDGSIFGSGRTYIYIAIRRGPMKVPTVGTSVFSPVTSTNNLPAWNTGFPVDMGILGSIAGSDKMYNAARLMGETSQLKTNTTDAAANWLGNQRFDQMNGYGVASFWGTGYIGWMMRRAPGFFDVVCYTGTGSATTQTHNLGISPQLVIVKARSDAGTNWLVFPSTTSFGNALYLNTTTAFIGSGPVSALSSTTVTFNYYGNPSYSASTSATTYVAYLFATCAGVSKVGSYTGNGSSQTIACGFAAGSRFVMIKRTDSTGDWYVWDSARGIVAGNDPHLSLNTTAAEVTTDDSVDTDNSGFIVNQLSATNVNVTSATYIFLAIA